MVHDFELLRAKRVVMGYFGHFATILPQRVTDPKTRALVPSTLKKPFKSL
ncbi:hypothetical protein UF75_4801 [Desulfosporosinus sp. I2]|nr:hypothetical protein UF75_4801 [Desulfosporosinus sp. I2]